MSCGAIDAFSDRKKSISEDTHDPLGLAAAGLLLLEPLAVARVVRASVHVAESFRLGHVEVCGGRGRRNVVAAGVGCGVKIGT